MSVELIYGRRPVQESLRAGRRTFHRLLIADSVDESERIQAIKELAKQHGLRIDRVKRDVLDSKVPRGVNNQGVLLEVSGYPYAAAAGLLDRSAARSEAPFFLLLDLLQDVQNVGTLLRAAEAVGIHGVIVQERRAAGITPAVVSASSGAAEHLMIAQVTNLVQTMKSLKEADVWLAGLDRGDDAVRIDQANLRGGLGLVVGSEGEGLRRLVRETCDFIIELPMRGQVDSLNAATAGSIVLYAAWQARDFSGVA